MTEHVIVPDERVGLELDEFLCLLFPLVTKGFLRKQVREGRVLVDGTPGRPGQRLRTNQVVSIDFDDERAPRRPVAPDIELQILYEDDAVMVVDKPAGLAVEPERWRREAASLSGAVLAEAFERSGGADEDGRPLEGALGFRPRLVHRIDKDTTGCVLVAKSLEAERALRQAFEDGKVGKSYLALVEGEYPEREGGDVIDLPIGPDARRSGQMRVHDKGKPARTRVALEQRFRGFSLLRCEPLTGRTHQIRVHLSAVGFPLVVDRLYGHRDALLLSEIKRGYRAKRGAKEPPLIDRLTLHAARLEFPNVDPGRDDGERTVVEAPLPKDLTRTLKQLSKVRPPRA